MASKLDRLIRSMKWTDIICLDLGVGISTPAGELMINILAVFSKSERDDAPKCDAGIHRYQDTPAAF
jgi:hypothetical protein